MYVLCEGRGCRSRRLGFIEVAKHTEHLYPAESYSCISHWPGPLHGAAKELIGLITPVSAAMKACSTSELLREAFQGACGCGTPGE